MRGLWSVLAHACWDSWFGWRPVFLGDEKLFYLLSFLKSYFGHRWGFKDSQVLFPNQRIRMQKPKDKDQSIFELNTGLILDNLKIFMISNISVFDCK